MSFWEDLRAPFDPKDVKWRTTATTKDGKKGLAAAYVDARAVMNRLDKVLGPDCWCDTYRTESDTTICRLSVKIEDEWIGKEDGTGGTKIEPEKGALSDAFKRAAVKWGVGRYLYDLPTHWEEINQYGQFTDNAVNRLRASLPWEGSSGAQGSAGGEPRGASSSGSPEVPAPTVEPSKSPIVEPAPARTGTPSAEFPVLPGAMVSRIMDLASDLSKRRGVKASRILMDVCADLMLPYPEKTTVAAWRQYLAANISEKQVDQFCAELGAWEPAPQQTEPDKTTTTTPTPAPTSAPPWYVEDLPALFNKATDGWESSSWGDLAAHGMGGGSKSRSFAEWCFSKVDEWINDPDKRKFRDANETLKIRLDYLINVVWK